MKHKFIGEACVYCGAEATTKDHILGRKFFLIGQRDNLPQVPACRDCNGRKAKYEAYLMTVLPFGAKHPEAAKTLSALVPGRLEKNHKLRRKLEKGFSESGGTSVPIEHESLEALFAMIAKALLWIHYGVRCGTGFDAIGSIFHDQGEAFFRSVIGKGGQPVKRDFGDGAFSYEGSQATDCPEATLWRFTVYGGVSFADSRMPGTASLAVAVTGPEKMIQNLRYRSVLNDPKPPKPGRNDQCPCLSGKKFKKCHGSLTATGSADHPLWFERD
ncbi:conserved hypothetical protein [Candidatus Koribacter versatilis Ellin345]|uniref:SEC-C motif domain protein n=1 Tax=Koribacter versatilis (strain Ellin345) TaxID=204669 RepID=Q1IK41_KORVE|nr:SEC-C metal-binding domain-containing protein [Candidatus Koribacter versatilis]ABF42759.1 conserved hypothetical protein [Candidatus Koribacter versatilis Ellin345]